MKQSIMSFANQAALIVAAGEWWNWYTQGTYNASAQAMPVRLRSRPPIYPRLNKLPGDDKLAVVSVYIVDVYYRR